MASLEKKFKDEGITREYLCGILPELSLPSFSPEEEKTLSFRVVEAPFGRGIYSARYKVSLSNGRKGVEFFVKEPLKAHALYGDWAGERDTLPVSLAKYEYGFLKHLKIPGVLHGSGTTERIIMPFYSNGSLDRLLMEWYSRGGRKGGFEQPLSGELYQSLEDVLRTLLETSLHLVQYKTRDTQGKLLVAKPDINSLRERVTQYFAALLTMQKGIRNGKIVEPLNVAREAGRVYAKVADELSSILEYLAMGRAVVHGDCRPENILVKTHPEEKVKEKMGEEMWLKGRELYELVDWGGARLGPINFDLVTLFNSYEYSLFGISHPDSESFPIFAELLYGAMACNHKIWERIVNNPERIEFHATEEEREDIVTECDLLRMWDSLNRAGVYSLSFLQYPQENRDFLTSMGDLKDLYAPERVINTYLRTLARLCNELGFENTAEIAQDLVIQKGQNPNTDSKRNMRRDGGRGSLPNRLGSLPDTHLVEHKP